MMDESGSGVGDAAGDVAGRVRQVIDAVGVSQREFARRIVMDPSKLSRSLGGTRRFTAAELARIADAGRVDAGWLLGAKAEQGAGVHPRHEPGAHPRHEPGAHSAREPGAHSAREPGTHSSREPGARPAREPGAQPVRERRGTSRDGGAVTTPDGGRPLQIVRETVRLVAECGFHAVRVADIAAACATSTAAIHYHFPGRDELLEAAVRWCMDEDTAHRAARIADANDAAGELRQLIDLQTPRTEQQRNQWAVWLDLWAEAARSTVVGRLHTDYYRQWRDTVADVIRRGVEQGVFRPVDPAAAALRLTALIDGLATQVLATRPGEPGTSPQDMHDALLAHVADTLAVRPA